MTQEHPRLSDPSPAHDVGRSRAPGLPRAWPVVAVAIGLAALALSIAACSLVNPFGEVKTSPDTGGAGGTGAMGGTGGTGAMGGTGGTGGTTGPTGGSGGAAHEANCLDGLDDDGDGDVDCADADCQPDHECVVAPAVGWNGPLYVAISPYDPQAGGPSACPDGKAPATYFASPSPAECTPCDCTWTGAACGAPQLLFNQLDCDAWPNGFWIPTAQATSTACLNLGAPDSGPCFYRIGEGAAVLDPGQCTTTGGTLTSPLPWGKRVDVCEAAKGGGCGGDKICVHKAPSTFEEAVCVTQDGDVSCPPGWLDRDLEIYGGGTDDRACQGCGCSVDGVTCEGGGYTVNVGWDCLPPPGQGTTAEIVGDGMCTSTIGLAVKGAYKLSAKPHLGTPVGLECTQSVASGSVETAGKARVCCRQLAP